MSFKVGDEVFWIHTHQDLRDDFASIEDIEILHGKIYEHYGKAVRVEPRCFVPIEYIYKTKQDCIDAFIKRLQEL